MAKWSSTDKLVIAFIVLVTIGIVATVIVTSVRSSGTASTESAPSDAITSSSSGTSLLTGASAGSMQLHSTAAGCPAGYGVTTADTKCDILYIGAGPANLYSAYLTSPILGQKVCIVDDKEKVGGKVQSVEAPQSTPSHRLYSPTHAEQLQSAHVRMRCLAQAMGIESYIRLSWFYRPKHWEFISATGFNTSNICPECWTWSAEKLLAPNGDPSSKGRFASQADGEKSGIPDLCNGLDYTECSIGDELWLRLIDGSNNAELQAKDFAVFADYARHRLQSSEAANKYFALSSGIGYIVTPRDTPTGAQAGFEYADEEWNGPSIGFYWPRGGPQQIWLKVAQLIAGNGSRFYMKETAQCFDKATDADKTTYPYVVRTDKRVFRAKSVIFGMPPGQYADTIKGTLGPQLAAKPEMKAVSSRFPQCSIELFFPNKWWFETRSQPTDGFYINAAKDFGIIDTPEIRNITEWTFYDEVNGNWFRYMPHPEIREMNLIRFLPDVCEEWNEVYLNGGNWAVEQRAIAIMRRLFEPELTVTNPLKSAYTYHKYGFGHFNGQTNVTTQDVRNFAKKPMGTERICFSGEGTQWQKAGWQEGAVDGALGCFDGPALSGYIAPGILANKVNKCSNSNGDVLSLSTSSISDRCLKLDNEVSMMESAGIDYCSGAKRSVENNKRGTQQQRERKDRLGQ